MIESGSDSQDSLILRLEADELDYGTVLRVQEDLYSSLREAMWEDRTEIAKERGRRMFLRRADERLIVRHIRTGSFEIGIAVRGMEAVALYLTLAEIVQRNDLFGIDTKLKKSEKHFWKLVRRIRRNGKVRSAEIEGRSKGSSRRVKLK